MSERSEPPDSGFTLIEVLVALVLSGLILGVLAAAMATSLNVSSSASDEVADSTDAGLVSAFLYRDAQAAGGVDPTTAQLAAEGGVSITSSAEGWAGCSQPGTLVIRFSWLDRSSVATKTRVVVTYALDAAKQLVRRVCRDGSTVDVVLGSNVAAASAECAPDPKCQGQPASVTLAMSGSGLRVPFSYSLTATMRAQSQVQPTTASDVPAPLVALGAASGSPCPTLTLGGPTITVIGDAVIGAQCGASTIKGTQATLQPTGTTHVLSGIFDPFVTLSPPTFTCPAKGANPTPIGSSAGPDAVIVYPAPVSITAVVAFAAGRHIFCQGLSITATGRLTGSGVLLYVAGATLSLADTAILDAAAPTSGPYANVLAWVATPQAVTLGGGARISTLSGTVYAPSSVIDVASSTGINVGGLIGQGVQFSGSGPIRLGLPIPRLSMSPATLPRGQVGMPYTPTTVTAAGGTAPYTWSASGLPPGLAINAATGVVSGSPTAPGTSAVIVTARDATAATASTDYSIGINDRLAISGPASLVAGQVGVAYTPMTVTSSGGTSPVAWSATGLPSGLTINTSTGAITGTPTASGSFTVVVTATDAITAVATRSYPLTIRAAPAIAGPATLPNGQVGVAYTPTTVTASGGLTPYSWSATGLPSGLAINASSGAISGTPTASGSFSIVVTATDAVAARATRTYPVTIAPAVSGCSGAIAGWQGEYFSNVGLTGMRTLCRDDAAINFDWGGGAADPSLPSDNFSVRWTRTETFTAGTYTFVLGSDDGGRLYVDGVKVLDRWVDQGYPSNPPSVSVDLTAGPHTIVMEYYERGGAARATLTYRTVTCPSTFAGWKAEFYPTVDLSGPIGLCRDDAAINFDWGSGAADPTLPSDNFSVRWTRTETFAAGTYVFTLGSDDGGRLYIDGTRVLDRWVDQAYPSSPPSVSVNLTAGSHVVVMEYYERGGAARATLTYRAVTCPSTFAGWKGEYYPTVDLTGPVGLCRDDATINFDWGSGSPDSSIPADNFSARWTKVQTFAAGTYRFVAGSDDGVRFYIDGVLVIDRWVDQSYPSSPPSVTRALTAGPHTLVVEYYERGGAAKMVFSP